MTVNSGKFVLLIFLLISLAVCSNRSGIKSKSPENPELKVTNNPNSKRNKETEVLFKNLKKLSETGKIMFGMANPTTIGYTNGPKNNAIDQSDCKDITGSHPAFHESDFMWYADTAFKKTDMQALRNAYQRGAVCGYCWHIRGRFSEEFYAKKEGRFTDDKDLVKQILASSDRSSNKALDWYLSKIDKEVVPVFKELGFPLVFRPFHEMNGNWFWWGTDNCTADEYKQLFRLTVDYLRQNKVENLLYAWSVNVDVSFDFYPGDEYVDILGLDSYEPGITPWNPMDKFINSLGELTDYAVKTNKIAALTETGCRKDNEIFRYADQYPEFWTNHVLNPILADKRARRIVWIMTWYSADWNHDMTGQYYIPYRGMKRPNGQKATEDFLKFHDSNNTLFENDLPNMYKE